MRIDSCRNCGVTLEVRKYCQVCNQPLLFVCPHCAHFADDPVHTECNLKTSLAKHTLA